jgi:hypothetical protein
MNVNSKPRIKHFQISGFHRREQAFCVNSGRWRHKIPPRYWYLHTGLLDVTSQKSVLSIPVTFISF